MTKALQIFEQNRARLRSLGYRLLGSPMICFKNSISGGTAPIRTLFDRLTLG
jgi:hypothetical protein